MPQTRVPWSRIVDISQLDMGAVHSFSCGEPTMDKWLHESSEKDRSCGLCVVHACVDDPGNLLGFFTLSMGTLEPCTVPSGLAGGIGGAIPSVLLGRIGIHSGLRGNGVGTHALNHAMKIAYDAGGAVSWRAMYLDAKNDKLAEWYSQHGFTPLPKNPHRMVMKKSKVMQRINDLGHEYFVI